MSSKEPIHLSQRDRVAFAFRVAGALLGFTAIIVAFATASWSNPWVIGLVGVIIVGGGLAYHLLTSMISCPTCDGTVSNFRIAGPEEKRKLFSCARCGAGAWLKEGFYWQREISG